MYWFRQRPDESLEHIVYFYVAIKTMEKKFEQKVLAVRESNSLNITLKALQFTDSGDYFCAKQDAQHVNVVYILNKNTNSTTQDMTQHLLIVKHQAVIILNNIHSKTKQKCLLVVLQIYLPSVNDLSSIYTEAETYLLIKALTPNCIDYIMLHS